MKEKLEVGILGATGMVGAEYVRMLADHPWFKVKYVVGKKSAGKKFKEAKAGEWVTSYEPPKEIAEMMVQEADPEHQSADMFFSCLPTDAARELEPLYAKYFPTYSDASAYRMEPDVPLLIPEINPEQWVLIKEQGKRGWKGFLTTGPNCTSIGLNLTLKPLHEDFKIKKIVVSTMQAVSGAGFPGVASMSILDNVIPYIKDEEEKVFIETNKILGKVVENRVEFANIDVAAMCHRVPTIDGHMESVYMETEKKITPEDAADSLKKFRGLPQELKLPTAPDQPIIVREEPDRPQTRLDRYAGSVPGMSVVVGRIRKGLDDHSIRYTLLSHNTVRGAAGNTILTAEMFHKEGWMYEYR
ncbi:MAG: aspartate-semialdehyde dehydrogenase [Nitrososphaeria archaeon]|nr:aspartate-semialdehyde dehydrogenase [Conexivisphaerales archaeon]